MTDITLSIAKPQDDGNDYIGSNHSIMFEWESSFVKPDSMKYVISIMNKNDTTKYEKFDQPAQSEGDYQRLSIPSTSLWAGDNTVSVSLASSDGVVIDYAHSDSISFYLFADEASYQRFISTDPMADYKAHVQSSILTARNSQAFFTTGTRMDDGSISRVDVAAMTSGSTKVLTAIATGNYTKQADWISVQGMYFADLFMRRMSTSSYSNLVNVSLFKDLFSFLKIPNNSSKLIIEWLEDNNNYPTDGLERVIRTVNGEQQAFIRWNDDWYKNGLGKLEENAKKQKVDSTTLKGIGLAIKFVDKTAKIIDALKVYSSVPNSSIDYVVSELNASGYPPLQTAATFLSGMKTTQGKLVFIALNVLGADFAQGTIDKAGFEVVKSFAEKNGVKYISKIANMGTAAAGALLVGVQIGAAVGHTVNNVVLNIDGIYTAWQKTKWCSDAADAMYNRLNNVANGFYEHPESNYNRETLRKSAYVYTELVADTYSAFSGVYKELDNAWISQIKNWVTHDQKNAQGLSSSKSMANLMRTYLDSILSEDCYNNYATSN